MNTNEVIAGVLPQFFPTHWLENPGIVFSDFPSRIRVGYVLRQGGAYSYVIDDEFAALRLSVQDLHAAALTNLARLPSASMSIAKVPGGAEGWLSATDDNFAAVRILLPTIQQQFGDELGGRFLLTLPHRDDCFCWSLAQPEERQAKHAKEALEDFLRDEYNLTPDVLLFSNGEFRLHLQQDVEPSAAPEGGPAARIGNSNATEGPPPVS